ncbi:MAG: PilZ domain-containing protein [Myxococcota bacterium]
MTTHPLKVTLRVARPGDVLVRCYPNGKVGGLTVDGSVPGALGQHCELVVRIAQPVARHFNVRGQLAWARHQSSMALKECFGVDFLPDDEAGRDRLLSYAKEEVEPGASRYEDRIYTSLPVKISHQGKTRREFLFDLSQGGAFVRSARPLPVGAEVLFVLRPPLSLTVLRLKGRVVWVRSTGHAQGMGIEFQFEDPKEADGLRRLLVRLDRQAAQR